MKAKISTLILIAVLYAFSGFSQANKISFQIIDGIQDDSLRQKLEQNSTKLFAKLNEAFSKSYELPLLDEKTITPEGLEKIMDLWRDGRFYCPADKIAEIISHKGDGFQIRNIPIIYGKEDKFDVVIEYSSDGRITDFYIALDAHQYKTVMDATSVIDRTRREIIANFLENLRTAYVKKDISYIEKLYSDKALIITGKVLKTGDVSTDQFQKSLTKDQIKYQILTKTEYMSKLRKVFNSISYLRLDFKDVSVERSKKHVNFYGIKLRQIWESSGYKDDGLLFLMVQFKDNEDPVIWVRTWQDTQKTPSEDVFDMHNFKISTGNSIQ
jgi:hypothetical protein